MTPEEIKANNTTIAEFMGAKQSDYGDYMIFTKENPRGSGKINHHEILYHESWDWLMPVIEKISTQQYSDEDDFIYLRTFGMKDPDGNYMVRFNRGYLHSESSLIQAAYSAVLEIVEGIKRENTLFKN